MHKCSALVACAVAGNSALAASAARVDTQAAEGDEGDVRRAHGKANAQVGVQDIRDTKEHAHKLEVAYRIRAGHAQDARNQVGRESATPGKPDTKQQEVSHQLLWRQLASTFQGGPLGFAKLKPGLIFLVPAVLTDQLI